MSLVEIKGVTKSFGPLHAVDDVTLSVEQKETVIICGPSGAGKSTLLRCVNGLEKPQKGGIWVDGLEITGDKAKLREARKEIGIVFQSFNLFPHMDVLHNLILGPMKAKKIPRSSAVARAEDLLAKMGLSDKMVSYPDELSGGQAQRVAIARALAMDPKLMLFDEPTSALDPEMIKDVLDVMADLSSRGMTMMVVSHEMGFARLAANRVVFMVDGRIVEEAPPEVFFESPKDPRSKQFVDQIIGM